MKKIALLLALVLCLTLCACGGKSAEQASTESAAAEVSQTESNDTKLTITNNEGTVEEMTWGELRKLADENEARFNKYYKGAKVTAVGVVGSIDSNFVEKGNLSIFYDKITLVDGAEVKLLAGSCNILVNLKKGDKVKIVTNIAGIGALPVMHGCDEGGAYNKKTLARTTVELVK